MTITHTHIKPCDDCNIYRDEEDMGQRLGKIGRRFPAAVVKTLMQGSEDLQLERVCF